MATEIQSSLVVLLVAVGISIAMFSIPAKANDLQEPIETKMSVYFHDDSSGGPNSTTVAVVGFSGKLWTFTQFGTLYATDDPITEGPEFTSPIVGRGQGMFVTTSLEGLNTHVSLSIVFTNEAYSGSTIQIQGNSNQLKTVREYGVVSGTGKFRFAKGYATFENYAFRSASYVIIRCNISIRHYY